VFFNSWILQEIEFHFSKEISLVVQSRVTGEGHHPNCQTLPVQPKMG
jgi:uncharacterized protein YwqG